MSRGVSNTFGAACGVVHANRTTSCTYTPEGLLATVDGPRTDVADVTTYTYDALGNPKWYDSYALAEHQSNKTPSNREKHENANARRGRDRGGEKGDTSRSAPRKKPKGHKGPWPPRPRSPGITPIIIWDILQYMCGQGIHTGIGCSPENDHKFL